MNPISLLFFGSQGAGKGTQVKMLMDYLSAHSPRGIIRIDMGQELRGISATGSYTSKFVNETLLAGRRVPDFLAIYAQTKLIIENLTGEEHVIADGLARGEDQTRGFDDMMKYFGRDFVVINLVINDETAVKRLVARGRNDDTESAIRNRLAWTKSDVMPQLQLLKSRGRTIIEVDGEPDVETIHRTIIQKLGLS